MLKFKFSFFTMPLIKSTYKPSGIYRSADLNTIYAATLRTVKLSPYVRERITLSDEDFLDLDWSKTADANNGKVAILLHGLAGSSDRPYMKGMTRILNKKGWDTVSINLRGCSEELNKYFKSYHGGSSQDLAEVIDHIKKMEKYDSIALVGFSLGGNILLKYLGEDRNVPKEVKTAVAVSVPCDLAGSLGEINRTRNFIYSKRFELKLKQVLLARAKKFPEKLSKKEVEACSSLNDIDELYTSKAHGFENAADYYEKNSSRQFLENIKIPTLIISSKDDSFLSNSAYPIKEAENSEFLNLEIPEYGGHVGFVLPGPEFYHEKRTMEFLEKHLQV